MHAHLRPLVMLERTRLEQNAVRHRDLSKVMAITAEPQGAEPPSVTGDPLAEGPGVRGQPLTVALRVGVPRLHGLRQRPDQLLGALELTEEHLDLEQGRNAGAQLGKVHRLWKEVIGPRRPAG